MSVQNEDMEQQETKKVGKKRYVFLLWVICLSPFALLAGLLLIANGSDLPDTVALANPKTNLATEVIASDGVVLGKFFLENRTNVSFEQLSPHLVNGLIAT
jgi:penicillin-binding protein 1A